MRHRVYGKHLGRNKDQRDNLFRGLTQALLTHGTIRTSETKAKAIKPLIDKIITSAKSKTSQELQAFLTDKNLQDRLVKEIIPKLGSRTSGYTATVRMGTRPGDQTAMVRMSLIGAEELKPITKESRIKNKELSKKPEKLKRKITGSNEFIETKTTQTKRKGKKA